MRVMFLCLTALLFLSAKPKTNAHGGLSDDPDVYDVTFIGDSRTVGMRAAIQCRDTNFICEVGEGYNWLVSSSVQNQIKKAENETEYWIFCLGVNDLGNAQKYIDYLNDFAENHDGIVCCMSVNPVDDVLAARFGYQVDNAKIDDFNSKLADGLENVYWLDTNWILEDYGFETVDGLHYKPETYRMLYDYIYHTFSLEDYYYRGSIVWSYDPGDKELFWRE